MNMNEKILNKRVANQIQKYIKSIIYHNLVWFVPQSQGWLNIRKSINVIHQINMIIPNEAQTAFTVLKVFSKLELQGNFLNLMKCTY